MNKVLKMVSQPFLSVLDLQLYFDFSYLSLNGSWDNGLNMVTRLQVDECRVWLLTWVRDFSFLRLLLSPKQ